MIWHLNLTYLAQWIEARSALDFLEPQQPLTCSNIVGGTVQLGFESGEFYYLIKRVLKLSSDLYLFIILQRILWTTYCFDFLLAKGDLANCWIWGLNYESIIIANIILIFGVINIPKNNNLRIKCAISKQTTLPLGLGWDCRQW